MSETVVEQPAVEQNDRHVIGERLNISPGGKRFTCDFIEPGFVNYSDAKGGGMELLRKETIDEALQSAIGNPLTVMHIPTTMTAFEEVEHGKVDMVGYNQATNWYTCGGSVDTDDARQRMKHQRPSCGYRVLEFGPGGVDHNIRYDREIKKIRFHHLAIVDNPRYAKAEFRLNSLTASKGKTMFKWIQKLTRKEKDASGVEKEVTEERVNDIAPETVIDLGDGKTATLKQLQEAYAEVSRANAVHAIGQNDELECEGHRYKMNELVDAYRKNEKAEKEKKDKDGDSHTNAIETPEQKAAKAAAAATAAQRAAEGANAFRVLGAARANGMSADTALTPPPADHTGLSRSPSRYGEAPKRGK